MESLMIDVLQNSPICQQVDLKTLVRLSVLTHKIRISVSGYLIDKVIELPTMRNIDRDASFGALNLFGALQSESHLLDCHENKRKEHQSWELLTSAKNLRLPTVETASEAEHNIDRLTAHLLRPIWDAHLPVVLAGGSVLRALHHTSGQETDSWNGDFDLWCKTSNDESAISVAESVLQAWQDSGLCEVCLDGQLNSRPTFQNGRLTLAPGTDVLKVCLCVHDGFAHPYHTPYSRYKFDIILKGFDSTLAIISRFDLDCCRLAYDGSRTSSRFMTTYSGLTAYRTGVNYFDLEDAGRTQAFRTLPRMVKYASRGFTTTFIDASDVVSFLLDDGSNTGIKLIRRAQIFLHFHSSKCDEYKSRVRSQLDAISSCKGRQMTYMADQRSSKPKNFIEWFEQCNPKS